MFKFVVLVATVAVARAGVLPAPGTYAAPAAPLAYAAPAPAHYGYAAPAPAHIAYAAPAPAHFSYAAPAKTFVAPAPAHFGYAAPAPAHYGYAAPIAKAIAPAAHVVKAIETEYDPNPQYSYTYSVQDAITGDTKSAEENRNGDVVQGSYSLLEADGTTRTVKYTADPVNGFNAVVEKTGTAIIKPVAPIHPAPAAYAYPAPAAYTYPAPATYAKTAIAAPVAYGGYATGHFKAAVAAPVVSTHFNGGHASYAY